ncbi:MAG TPA: hypothetical protein VHG29_03380 [Novosphingobium sp.]|nr:hypothetical protein [Novosphingobium sp.]
MDSLRGNFYDRDSADQAADYDSGEDEVGREVPPSPIGQDERRMQVRAYNHWASLLDNRNFPSIEDLHPDELPDFGPHSVLLDFTNGIENPAIQYLGDKLAQECGATGPIGGLNDVPSRSLLSRITDHYMQILANQAPIGFEAEFVNQREHTILYRGILLPFSSDDDTIDFIYGVINWKELADQQTTDELLLEIDQALEGGADHARPAAHAEEPLTEWADGPVEDQADVLDLTAPLDHSADILAWPEPAFGIDDPIAEEAVPSIVAEPADTGMALADWLASARELAQAAQGSEDRTRHALYAAIGRAYDFSLAAVGAPEEFDELVSDSGLTVQDRAPMTPVVKLVFGAEYDKTRLTEYASALGHAHRLGLERGTLAGFLASAPGGLKGVVNAERQLKREETGKPLDPRETPTESLARKLRQLGTSSLDSVASEGTEFTLLLARRLPSGEVVLVGEVAEDTALLERAARKLL